MVQQLISSLARYKLLVLSRRTSLKSDRISLILSIIILLQLRLFVVIIPKRSFDRVHLKLATKHCLLLLLCLKAGKIHLTKLLSVVFLLDVELTVLSPIIDQNFLVPKPLGTTLLLLVNNGMMRYNPFDAVFGY